MDIFNCADSIPGRVMAMIFKDPNDLRQRISKLTMRDIHKPKIFSDTSAFMSIDTGSVLRIGGNDFLVLGTAREGRFGIDEQPKFWVKKTIDLTTGERKILKLQFDESFSGRIGTTVFNCTRNSEKESAILQRMKGHPNFMQGTSVRDSMGNLVRIIDIIPGSSLYENLRRLDMPHEVYYRDFLSEVIQKFIGSIEAIVQLHQNGFHHGDIRADHILINKDKGDYVWIDFDYEVSYPDYDLFCLGNILHQVVGKGRHSLHDVTLRPSEYPDFKETLSWKDMSLMFPHRVANLQKLFPYISEELNDILIHFSAGGNNRYHAIEALLTDLRKLFM
jgi:serine/threonine protein kinase